MQCRNCSSPLSFLLQVYSPDNKSDTAFHRSLFVFICTTSSCWEQGKELPLVVLRSQLGRSNQYYPWEPPEERDGWREDIKAEAHGKLCAVCGCPKESVGEKQPVLSLGTTRREGWIILVA